MPDDSLIHPPDADASGPATHVLIVGVGHYDHLPGGSGKVSKYKDAMGQLSSPPTSARAVADWFVSGGFDNPERRLGSVALLLSESEPSTFEHPVRGILQVPQARMEAFGQAIEEWFGRCSEHPDNLAVFYFCGHGVASGSRAALLLRDYGANDINPFRGALDLNEFLVAMETCPATHQVYFLDACRVASATLIRSAVSVGEKPILPDPSRRFDIEAPVQQSTYHAALPGEAAYGRPSEVSVFTEALLKCLQGAAAVFLAGEWWTNSTRLLEALTFFSNRVVRQAGGAGQVPESSRQSVQRINRVQLDHRSATAYVMLDDPQPWSSATLSCIHGPEIQVTMLGSTLAQQNLHDWEITVQAGMCRFEVNWVEGTPYVPDQQTAWVVPPYLPVILKVKP